jgi:hypothetical protein
VTVPSSDAGGLPLDLDRIEALANAATPGPWEPGDIWLWAAVGFGGPDKCSYCASNGEPVWIGKADINGRMRKAHKHRSADPYAIDHYVSAEDGLVVGPYDYDTGGFFRYEDTVFTCAARTDVPALVARVRALEAEADRLRDERDLAVEGRDPYGHTSYPCWCGQPFHGVSDV